MANTPEEPVQTSGGQTKVSNSPSDPTGQTLFDINLFLKQEGTRVVVGKHDQKQEGLQPEKVRALPERIKVEYSTFLNDYITDLAKMREQLDPANPNRTLLEAVLENQNHLYDRYLLDILSDETVNKKNKVIDITVNPSKIDKFLKSSRGVMITTQLLEYQTEIKLFALGLHAATLPPGERKEMADPNNIPLGIDQGWIRRLANSGATWLGERATLVGGRTNTSSRLFNIFPQRLANGLRNLPRWKAGGIAGVSLGVAGAKAGAVVGGIAGAPLAASVAGGLGAAAVVGYLGFESRNGVTMDLRQCHATFEAINSDPVERAYVKARYGLDTNRYTPVGNNGFNINPAGQEPRINPEQLKKEALQGLYTRMEFYKDFLGVPPENMDALPSQHIYWQLEGRDQPEQSGARWQIRTADEMQRLGGIITGDITGSLTRYMQAQRSVMINDLREFIQLKQTKDPEKGAVSTKETGKISELQKKKEKLQGEDYKMERARSFNERKDLYNNSKTELSLEKDKVDKYKDTLTALETTRGKIQSKYAISDVAGIDKAIKARETSKGVTGKIGKRREALLTAVRAKVVAEISTYPVGKARESAAPGIIQNYDKIYKPSFDSIDKEEARINAEIDELKLFKEELQTREEAISDASATTIDARESFTNLTNDFNTISGIDAQLTGAGLPASGLAENDLRTESIDILLQRINQANVAGVAATPPIAVGWPSDRNQRPELRMQVMRAIVEARVRNNPPPAATAAREVLDLGVPIDQLRKLGVADLFTEINVRNIALGKTPWNNDDATMDYIRRAREQMIGITADAYANQMDSFDKGIEQQEKLISGVNTDAENQRLELTMDIMQRQGEIYGRAWDFAFDSRSYVDDTPVGALNHEYTEQERSTPQPGGYYEIMDLIFDYKSKDNRGEYFTRINQILPPARLAELLNRSLNLGIAGAPAINNVLVAINNGLNNTMVLDPRNIRRAFRDIVNTLHEEANAVI